MFNYTGLIAIDPLSQMSIENTNHKLGMANIQNKHSHFSLPQLDS